MKTGLSELIAIRVILPLFGHQIVRASIPLGSLVCSSVSVDGSVCEK